VNLLTAEPSELRLRSTIRWIGLGFAILFGVLGVTLSTASVSAQIPTATTTNHVYDVSVDSAGQTRNERKVIDAAGRSSSRREVTASAEPFSSSSEFVGAESGGARFAVDSAGEAVDALSPSGKLPFPKDLIPSGEVPNAYGNRIWGVGPDGAKAAMGRSAQEIGDLGLDVPSLQRWQDFYSNVRTLNPKNPSAGPRVRIMQDMIDTMLR
jgi:hypothetical protein